MTIRIHPINELTLNIFSDVILNIQNKESTQRSPWIKYALLKYSYQKIIFLHGWSDLHITDTCDLGKVTRYLCMMLQYFLRYSQILILNYAIYKNETMFWIYFVSSISKKVKNVVYTTNTFIFSIFSALILFYIKKSVQLILLRLSGSKMWSIEA